MRRILAFVVVLSSLACGGSPPTTPPPTLPVAKYPFANWTVDEARARLVARGWHIQSCDPLGGNDLQCLADRGDVLLVLSITNYGTPEQARMGTTYAAPGFVFESDGPKVMQVLATDAKQGRAILDLLLPPGATIEPPGTARELWVTSALTSDGWTVMGTCYSYIDTTSCTGDRAGDQAIVTVSPSYGGLPGRSTAADGFVAWVNDGITRVDVTVNSTTAAASSMHELFD